MLVAPLPLRTEEVAKRSNSLEGEPAMKAIFQNDLARPYGHSLSIGPAVKQPLSFGSQGEIEHERF